MTGEASFEKGKRYKIRYRTPPAPGLRRGQLRNAVGDYLREGEQGWVFVREEGRSGGVAGLMPQGVARGAVPGASFVVPYDGLVEATEL